MPPKRYNQKLTNAEIVKLLESGKYWVDIVEGKIYSERTLVEVSTFNDNPGGYFFVRLYDQPKSRFLPVHHVVWMAGTKEPLPSKWEVHHADTDPHNNSFDNLIALHPIDHRKMHPSEVEDVPF